MVNFDELISVRSELSNVPGNHYKEMHPLLKMVIMRKRSFDITDVYINSFPTVPNETNQEYLERTMLLYIHNVRAETIRYSNLKPAN